MEQFVPDAGSGNVNEVTVNSFDVMKLSRALERAVEEGLESNSLVEILAGC